MLLTPFKMFWHRCIKNIFYVSHLLSATDWVYSQSWILRFSVKVKKITNHNSIIGVLITMKVVTLSPSLNNKFINRMITFPFQQISTPTLFIICILFVLSLVCNNLQTCHAYFLVYFTLKLKNYKNLLWEFNPNQF